MRVSLDVAATRRIGILALTILMTPVLAGCAAGAASPTTGSSAAGQAGSEDSCPAVDIRTPNGAAITLTGTWLGDDEGYWQVYQQGNCVWWMGYGHQYQTTMRGTVMPDFTISVEFARVGVFPLGAPPGKGTSLTGHGKATLKIDLTKGSAPLTVRVVDGGPGTTVWTRVFDKPIFPPPTPNP